MNADATLAPLLVRTFQALLEATIISGVLVEIDDHLQVQVNTGFANEGGLQVFKKRFVHFVLRSQNHKDWQDEASSGAIQLITSITQKLETL